MYTSQSMTVRNQVGAFHERNPTDRETVQGQLRGLLSGDSDYIQNARRAGTNYAARRGLMNSSLAAQSAQNAAIQSALPIASQDASMYAQAAAQNMAERNAHERSLAEIEGRAWASSPVLNNHDWVDAEREKDRQHQLLMQEREISLADRARREEQQYGRELTAEERAFLRENRDIGYDFEREGWGREDRLIGGERDWQRELIGYERDERQRDRDYDRSMFDDTRADRRAENRQALYGGAFQMMLSTLFSSPDFFSNPQSASGFMEFFSSRFGELIDGYFGG